MIALLRWVSGVQVCKRFFVNLYLRARFDVPSEYRLSAGRHSDFYQESIVDFGVRTQGTLGKMIENL